METKPTLPDLLNILGVKVESVYLGYQVEKGKTQDKDWPHFAWRVTVTRGEKSHSFDYRQGIGHAKPIPPPSGFRPDLPEYDRVKAWYKQMETAIPPKAADVVYSLISDAQSGQEIFEDFCSNFEYDTDSRKALDTYIACQAAYSACRRLFREHYHAVCEASQDY